MLTPAGHVDSNNYQAAVQCTHELFDRYTSPLRYNKMTYTNLNGHISARIRRVGALDCFA